MTQSITKIEAQKRKGRFNVYVDGQYAFPISKDVFIKYRLFKGMELDKQLIETLKNADNISKLHTRALNYLAHNLRTEHEVRSKLLEITDNLEAIDQVISQLKDQQLVNDRKYADSYVRTVVRQKKNGPNWIRQKLFEKKVPKSLIDASIADFFPEDQMIEIGISVADNQLRHHQKESEKMVVNKIKETLVRRGFGFDIVPDIMEKVDTSGLASHDSDIIGGVAEKYWRKYAKLEKYKQFQKTRQALFRKGFSMDDIEAALENLAES